MMMDFDNILDIASQNQGLSNVKKRYSLQVGPQKKDPKSKGVNPNAVQALLKKQFVDTKKKELQMKKQKEALLAKRVELKSDRKARAMASRTKDNFKGYNGIPVVDVPKKRGSKSEMQQSTSRDAERFHYNSSDPLDDEDNYEYETDSEPEQEEEFSRPGGTASAVGKNGSDKLPSKKPSGPPKSGPLNFADLLKIAEKKQFEPVELKQKVGKSEERPRTADEIRELEMERKARSVDKNKDHRTTKERDMKSQSSSNVVRKSAVEREQKQCRPQKNCVEKPSGSSKKMLSAQTSNKGISSSKSFVSNKERDKITVPQNNKKSSNNLYNASGAINNKAPSKASSQVSAKPGGSRPLSSHKSSASSDLSFRKESSSLIQKGSGNPGHRPSSAAATSQKSQHGRPPQTRPNQGSFSNQGPSAGSMKTSKGEPVRNGMNSNVKLTKNSVMRPSSGPPKTGGQPQGRPFGVPQNRPSGAPQARTGGSSLQDHPRSGGSRPPGSGPARPGSGGHASGRLAGSLGSGPGRPKCTVVSETISSKNVGVLGPGVSSRPGMQQRPGMGSRPGMPPRSGMPSRPGMPPRPGMPSRPGMPPRLGMPPGPMMNRPPGTMLPPITSAYKRKYEDEEDEYDSEMDDFIDDGGDEQEEISRHIKEIFGYDRNKYKDESDYALKFMESSWKDLQKEESRSLRLAVQEDLEEERKEQEELKRKAAKRKKH